MMERTSNYNWKELSNIQPFLAIGYLFMVIIGIVFIGAKFAYFGINIFNYSDFTDYILAPFRNVSIILYATCPILIVCFLYLIGDFISKKYQRTHSILNFGLDKKPWFKYYWMAQFIFAIVVYVGLSSLIFANSFKKELENNGNVISVQFQDKSKIKGKEIGANSQYIFLIDELDSLSIIPISSIERIIKPKGGIPRIDQLL